MKIFHLKFATDTEASAALPEVDKLDNVLDTSAHHAYGNGPAFLVVVTQDSFDTSLFQHEYSLMYEDKHEETKPASEVEVLDIEDLPEPEPIED